MQLSALDLLLHGQVIAVFGTDNHFSIYLLDLLFLFLGLSLYGLCWSSLRVRGKKEWVATLPISVLLLTKSAADL
jgi:hypothetical protein